MRVNCCPKQVVESVFTDMSTDVPRRAPETESADAESRGGLGRSPGKS